MNEMPIEQRIRDEELGRIPMWIANKERWPKDVRTVGMDEFDNLGIDRLGNLYWDGKAIEIRRISLSGGQKILASFIAFVGFWAAVGATLQGWTSAHSWLCELHWLSQPWCPLVP
ncbi:hypothetical protein [Allomesorhizobium alhagi]|jgi:hypothetical protein|uniref:hypothetical protein n=1 Tax=Allomesorhizobium alhagi TaxID=475067 RepID=UPI0011127F64|nr:hypothetical protein [Mesorhizobium alhagi]